MPLLDAIKDIKNALREGRFPNEAAVETGVVLRILDELGWPVFDPVVVAPKISVPMLTPNGNRREPDFALQREPGKPLVCFEVKAVGRNLSEGQFQLFEQCFHAGAEFAVLTDGQEWRFYLPMRQGDAEDRMAYKLDLLAQNDEECCLRLERYLSRQNVFAEDHLKNALSDLTDTTRGSRIQNAFPQALAEMLADPDERLIELISEKVSYLCGFAPDEDACSDFLRQCNISLNPPLGADPPPQPASTVSDRGSPLDNPSFVLHGQRHDCRNNISVMVGLLNALAKRDPGFLERFASRKHGTVNRFAAQNKYDLYPNDEQRCENMSVELDVDGWFAATNNGESGIKRCATIACEVAGIRFGEDLTIHLKRRSP